MLSIIIPYHNEGQPFIDETIRQIRETIDLPRFEIIVVDDGSDVPVYLGRADQLIRHDENLGVGAAFDTGVKYAKYENLFLMGCDIRFIANGWASNMLVEIGFYPKSFICSSCVVLNQDAPENMDIEKRRKISVMNGATILMFHDQKSNPKQPATFRGIIEAQWLPRTKEKDSFDIPCILGAAYGVKKDWYEYIDGWAGHRKWGTLEPYISLKSWLFGGSCRTAPSVETGHIFKKHGTHGTPQDILLYNKMMVATMLLDDHERLISFLGENPVVARARKMYNDNLHWILNKRKEYKWKIVTSPRQFFQMWGIDYREEAPVKQGSQRVIDSNYIRNECNTIYSNSSNAYAAHYSKSPYIKVWIKMAAMIQPGEHVVDIGCGVGQVMDLLLDKGIASYHGIDVSPVAISKACERLAKRPDQDKVSLSCTDVYKSQIPAADKYVLAEILEHLHDDKELLRKIPHNSEVILTVPSFLGGSHVRKFDSEEEVSGRYSDVLECRSVASVTYGTGKIFVMNGIRI
jgi:glycosyltransferase involved in cell wall biosynthesis